MLHLSNLTKDEAIELGSKVGALIGLGIEGEEGIEEGAVAGAEAAADGVNVFSDDDAWDVIEEIPNDSAAALLLIEHHWAVPLRDAIARAGGFRISDGFISPLDLIEIGLLTAEEADGAATPSRRRRRRLADCTTTKEDRDDRRTQSRTPHLATRAPAAAKRVSIRRAA